MKTVYRLVAFTFKTNPENKPCVDHIDRNPQNNHVTNLRVATSSENNRNKSKYVNTSGTTGVYWFESRHKWRAHITVNYKKLNLGTFHSKRAAVAARKRAERRYFGEYIAH